MCAGKLMKMKKIVRKWLNRDEEGGEQNHCINCSSAVRRLSNGTKPTRHRWASCERKKEDYYCVCQRNSQLPDLVCLPSKESGDLPSRHSNTCLRLRRNLPEISRYDNLNTSLSDNKKIVDDCFCSSSQQPVPVCVCEDCFLISLHPSCQCCRTSSTTLDTDDCTDRGSYDSAHSDSLGNKKKRDYGHVLQRDVEGPRYGKHPTLPEPRSKSASKNNPSQLQHQPMEANLPPSICRSLDGEEGFIQSQRNLQSWRRMYLLEAECGYGPPPNKTICHVLG